MSSIVVFCHLRWNFVYQRPQHLLSRLASRTPVFYIEEPVRDVEREPWLEVRKPCIGVTVVTPHTPAEAPGFHDDQLPVLEPLIEHFVQTHVIGEYVAWLYTPMALPLVTLLDPSAVVYDCMDELSAFKGAPKQLRQRESALMSRADLVLTGGPSLFEAKRHLHPNVVCLPSAVDSVHFSRFTVLSDPQRRAMAEKLHDVIAAPRLGFFGVIDERLDLGLVAALADANSTWHVVMVGPVVKIDPADLPRRANLHWLGQQDYELLPHLLAQWDVCLLPFALNESTRFISPTKTLEYMSFGLPIVSTAIRDVTAVHAETVRIGHDHASFVQACRESLAETSEERRARSLRMASTVARCSWDAAVATVRGHLDELARAQQEQPPIAARA